MTNPDGNERETSPSDSGSGSGSWSSPESSTTSSSAYEAPPIERSQSYEPSFGSGQSGDSSPAYGSPPSYPPADFQSGGYPPPPPGGYPPPPGYGAAPGGYGAQSGGYGYPPPGYGDYAGAYGAPSTKTNGLAIGSLVASALGLLCGIGSIVGIVLGIIALNQVKQRNEGGRGLAIAGIAVGAATLVISFVLTLAILSV